MIEFIYIVNEIHLTPNTIDFTYPAINLGGKVLFVSFSVSLDLILTMSLVKYVVPGLGFGGIILFTHRTDIVEC